jgi:uncharacterized protein (TIGR03437 family)
MRTKCLCLISFLAIGPLAFPQVARDRISVAVDAGHRRIVTGALHRLAQPRFDQGAVDPSTPMNDVLIVFKPTAAQQTDLETLLNDQQNPSSPRYHKWLTPAQFGDRFGLSAGDLAKIATWLRSEGLTVNRTASGRNWISFGGTTAQVSKALRTSLHRFDVDGEKHFAAITEPSVPEAFADVVAGFIGLHDFDLKPLSRLTPASNSGGGGHVLAPEDYATIYNIAPLYQAGIDGTEQSIAVVGASSVQLSDLRAFRDLVHLPPNDPKMVLYSSTDPGFRQGVEDEAILDLEWAGAIAPNATVYYVYGSNAYLAIVYAVNMNLASIITSSFVGCEAFFSTPLVRASFQQGNAQGITILNSSGDSGAAGCDFHDTYPLAARGRYVEFPAVMPEVTAVGGTQFVEGSGNYWASTNSPNLGSALSYIPEKGWNESSSTVGLASSGGGASLLIPKPAWQVGPGVPNDNARDVPDISLSAALHDPYLIYIHGHAAQSSGTSASAPSMAGVVALLNHYQISHGFQSQPGLGNINPHLYRLAQSVPSVFHDITSGDNIVPCAQGSPDCITGSFGYAAGLGYDLVTGLGSVDVNNLATNWNTATNKASVNLQATPTNVTLNDSITITATISPVTGRGVPTGSVEFGVNGNILGSAALVASGASATASFTFPAYLLNIGTYSIVGQYSGDAAFGAGGSTITVQISRPTGAAAIAVLTLATVYPDISASQELVWNTSINLRETAGISATITEFLIDGELQSLSQYFGSPNIPAAGSVTARISFTNLAAPVTRTFTFNGTDSLGQTWSRQVAILFVPAAPFARSILNATPSNVVQDTSADPSCQWKASLSVDEQEGNAVLLTALFFAGASQSNRIASIFGTQRLEAWGSLSGTICYGGITLPSSDTISLANSNGNANQVTLLFAGPAANPASLDASPKTITLTALDQPAQASLDIAISDATQPWTASIFPANRTTAWLSVNQWSGVGPGRMQLRASGEGFEPGVYRATIVIQSSNATPQFVRIPVMFVLGPNTSGMNIAAVANSFSYQTMGSPGMLLSVFGSQLSNSKEISSSGAQNSIAGVTASVNGLAAPILYVSPSLVNIQIPFGAGAGPAVLGINNNGQIAGFQFQMAPSAPGILSDVNGHAVPATQVSPGDVTTIFLTGAGDVPPLPSLAIPAPTTDDPASLPKPVLPVNVTVGGLPARIQFASLAPGTVGIAQVAFVIPPSVPPGEQPVVVTVGDAPSPPVNLTVRP